MIVGGVVLCSLGVLALTASLLMFVIAYEAWTPGSLLDMAFSFLFGACGVAMMTMSCIAVFVGVSLIAGTP